MQFIANSNYIINKNLRFFYLIKYFDILAFEAKKKIELQKSIQKIIKLYEITDKRPIEVICTSVNFI